MAGNGPLAARRLSVLIMSKADAKAAGEPCPILISQPYRRTYMRYKLHRIAPNTEGWQRPSGGRLGGASVGEYVHKNGFGHEDWNFNLDLARDGEMLGYTVANPSRKYLGETFSLVLATYDSGGWHAAGFYEGAEYIGPGNVELALPWVDQMVSDVFALSAAGDANPKYAGMSLQDITKSIREDFTFFNWKVPAENVSVFRQPQTIPATFFNPGRQRMMTSYDLTEHQFRMIAKPETSTYRARSEAGVEEGAKFLQVHKNSERSAKLVRAFKAGLSSYACTVCEFDFELAYGEIGAAYIECHHIKPVAKMKPGDATELSDLCSLCANCHRMLHRSDPMLTPQQLRERLRQFET